MTDMLVKLYDLSPLMPIDLLRRVRSVLRESCHIALTLAN